MLKQLLSRLHAPVYRRRLSILSELLLTHLRDKDRVLDVGCGSGQLGAELQKQSAKRMMKIDVCGLERFPRGCEPIAVTEYDGSRFPFPNVTFDMVIVADVLHHEEQPDALIRECVRVSKRLVVIKDHQLSGPLAKVRVSFIDWAANAPYGVECLYRYNTPAQWSAFLHKAELTPMGIYSSINLYPFGLNLVFGRRLQYLAVCRRPDNDSFT
jgi:ubiquinone/menaquinone biosynthesis C-methylase UbiE